MCLPEPPDSCQPAPCLLEQEAGAQRLSPGWIRWIPAKSSLTSVSHGMDLRDLQGQKNENALRISPRGPLTPAPALRWELRKGSLTYMPRRDLIRDTANQGGGHLVAPHTPSVGCGRH